MPQTVHVVPSHRWLHSMLFERAVGLPEDVRLVDSRTDADVIVYLDPPWPEAEDAVGLRELTRSELMRTFVFSQRDLPVPWLPGMYASLRARRGPTASAFVGGFYVADHLREPGGLAEHLAAARALEPDVLWSFAGTARNAHVRQRLLTLSDDRAIVRDTKRFSDTVRWGWYSTHRSEAQQYFHDYASTMGRSKFALCPRGRGRGSVRLFEAMEAGRCPVILADGWLAPPFVEWDSCSIRVAERDVAEVPRLLREREDEAADLGARARLAWEQHFSPETQLATLVRAAVAVSDRVGVLTRLALPPNAFSDPQFAKRTVRHTLHGIRRRALGKNA